MNARNIEKFHKKKIRVDANKCTLKNSEYASCVRKMRYRTEGDASHAIAKRRRNGDNTPLDIYYCSYCNGFHLTKSTDANRFLVKQLNELKMKNLKDAPAEEIADFIAELAFCGED